MKTHLSRLQPISLTLGLTVASMVALGCDKKDEQPAVAANDPGKAPPAAAGDPPPPTPRPPSGDPAAPGAGADQAAPGGGHPAADGGGTITDEQLEQFASAFREVQQLQSKIESDLSTAQSPTEAKELQQKASQKAAAIVEKSGLSMAEYSQIAQRLQGDEALRKRLDEKVRDSG